MFLTIGSSLEAFRLVSIMLSRAVKELARDVIAIRKELREKLRVELKTKL